VGGVDGAPFWIGGVCLGQDGAFILGPNDVLVEEFFILSCLSALEGALLVPARSFGFELAARSGNGGRVGWDRIGGWIGWVYSESRESGIGIAKADIERRLKAWF